MWGRMLLGDLEALIDQTTAVAKLLRTRFRVPFYIFEEVCACALLGHAVAL